MTLLGVKLCKKSIARIIEAWKCFLDPDSEKNTPKDAIHTTCAAKKIPRNPSGVFSTAYIEKPFATTKIDARMRRLETKDIFLDNWLQILNLV